MALALTRHIFLIVFISACATTQKSELEKDMELVAGFAGNEEQADMQTNTSNAANDNIGIEDNQEFNDQQGLQENQESDDDQGLQEDQEFDDEQGLQEDQEFDENEQGLQEDQEFDDQQGLQEDQEFDDQQNLQQGQQFEQLQELNDQFGQIASNQAIASDQANAFGEPPLQQGQNIQPNTLDFENSFNEQLTDNEPLPNNEQFQTDNLNNQTLNQSADLANNTTTKEPERDPIATILEEFKGIPEPNEFSGAELPGTMKRLATGEAPETYVIRSGDTLYDICDQLLDEATYWPKLWSMNSDIKNPHFIYPEFALQFYPGDLETPPVIKVVNIEEFEPEGDIKPNAAVETEKLFKEEPSNFELLDPEDVVIPEKIDELFVDDESMAGPMARESSNVELPALILQNRLAKLGKVARDESSMLEGDTILLKGSGLSVDTLYTVMRYSGFIWGLGHRYDFIANALILSNDGGSHASAMLTNLNNAPQKGDIVIDYRARLRRIDTNPSGRTEIDTKIAALTVEGQELGIAGDFAFIKVNGADISTQQVMSIYRRNKRSFQKKSKVLDSNPIGTMQVIDVQEDVAIAYITNSVQEIFVGDRTSP